MAWFTRERNWDRPDDVYVFNGFKDRDDYLRHVAREMGFSMNDVRMVADMLGPDEDFDGLVTELEDWL